MSGGVIVSSKEGKPCFRDSLETFRYRIADGSWRQITDHTAWRQFSLNYQRDLDSQQGIGLYTGEALTDLGFPAMLADLDAESDDYRRITHTLIVDDVPVRVADTYQDIRITFEGALPQDRIDQILAAIAAVARSQNFDVSSTEEL